MNKENKSKLEALLKKVANERDLEICGLKIQTNQNPIVIEITVSKIDFLWSSFLFHLFFETYE